MPASCGRGGRRPTPAVFRRGPQMRRCLARWERNKRQKLFQCGRRGPQKLAGHRLRRCRHCQLRGETKGMRGQTVTRSKAHPSLHLLMAEGKRKIRQIRRRTRRLSNAIHRRLRPPPHTSAAAVLHHRQHRLCNADHLKCGSFLFLAADTAPQPPRKFLRHSNR